MLKENFNKHKMTESITTSKMLVKWPQLENKEMFDFYNEIKLNKVAKTRINPIFSLRHFKS